MCLKGNPGVLFSALSFTTMILLHYSEVVIGFHYGCAMKSTGHRPKMNISVGFWQADKLTLWLCTRDVNHWLSRFLCVCLHLPVAHLDKSRHDNMLIALHERLNVLCNLVQGNRCIYLYLHQQLARTSWKILANVEATLTGGSCCFRYQGHMKWNPGSPVRETDPFIWRLIRQQNTIKHIKTLRDRIWQGYHGGNDFITTLGQQSFWTWP